MTTAWAPEARLPTPLRGAVLIGGASRRMGRSKAHLAVAGKSLAQIAAEALSPWVCELAWVGSLPTERSDADDPVSGWSGGLELPWRRLSDRPGVPGPLGALLACFDAEPESAWMVSACDLPSIRPQTMAWLLRQFVAGDLAVWPRAQERIHPLAAIYSAAARAMLETQAASGDRALHPMAKVPGVRVVDVPADLAPDFTNVNTLTEWSRFLAAR